MIVVPSIEDLMAACTASAVHLEMRDGYMRDDPRFIAWQEHTLDLSAMTEAERPWLAVVASTTQRGVAVCRARIVSEPISDYVRFEHDLTSANEASGELVRWLPRRQATSIALPGNDFWLFDGTVLLLNHFDGDGNFIDHELVRDPEVIKLCATAFEAVWGRAIPHEEYRPV
ncbi:hypothetical protein OG455_11910 [Kitasatospora sp. NBC_01287]|uniref:DUF6879 family protein n=1 Tax=Kitasatospora sp. NBC_01287 TaxID=2903573 RepID=UPI0022592A5A|nr:DUF6879 family protein [Kitasatospora sp. NBC_01287]MCX4746221.1 hypothetical protein [Kitasatospora sp. NBC_01287]